MSPVNYYLLAVWSEWLAFYYGVLFDSCYENYLKDNYLRVYLRIFFKTRYYIQAYITIPARTFRRSKRVKQYLKAGNNERLRNKLRIFLR